MPIIGTTAGQISGHLGPPIMGTSWTAGGTLPSPLTNGAVSTYGNNIFVMANGSQSSVATSTNGVTWTARTAVTTTNYMDYANGIFMGTGYAVAPQKSTDGINWSSVTDDGITNAVGICYGLGAWVTTEYGATVNGAATSTNNGTSWTLRTISHAIYNVAGNSSIVVGVSVDNSGTTSYTTNLSTWTTGTLPNNIIYRGISYGNNLFVTVSQTSGTNAASSTDGISWTGRTLPASQVWYGIEWLGANWIAVGSGTTAATSTDAITWTSRTIGSGDHYFVASNGIDRAVVGTDGSTATQYSTS